MCKGPEAGSWLTQRGGPRSGAAQGEEGPGADNGFGLPPRGGQEPAEGSGQRRMKLQLGLKLQNQKLILKLIQKNQSTLSKLKLDLEIDTNFLFTELGKLTFPNLTFLSIVIDENISQKDKVEFLLTSSKSFPKLTFIQFELYSISKSTTQMLLSKYPLLQEIQ